VIWVFPATYLPRLLFKSLRRRDPAPSWKHVTIVAWTGMRGVVSLAAALALPLEKADGSPFPGRDLILFLSFIIILATLVVQGLSLPPLIRWLGVEDDDSLEHEERDARLAANKAALERLSQVAEKDPSKTDALKRLRIEYEDRIRQLEATETTHTNRRLRLFSAEYERLSGEGLKRERETILKLRNQEVINDEVLRRILQDIDLAEARLRH
jgi:monovalent cation/hydrogen antiporter